MVTSILFLACALTPAQAPGPDWLLTPRLSRAQELVYKGTFAEETLGRSVQFSRNYRIESRVFVLNALAQSNEVILYTVLREQLGGAVRPAGMKLEEPSSVRLEPGTITAQGRVTLAGGRLLQIPLGGPPVLDCPAVVPVPNHRVALNQPWEIPEEGRPATVWTVVGTENLGGNPCLKVTGVQTSDDWDRPRADRASWRREDKVWLSTRAGTVTRMERVIELREAAHREPTQRTTTKYELESSIAYPGQLFDDRNREIAHARAFEESAAPLLQDPARAGGEATDAVLTKIKFYLDNQPPTPYREAVVQLRRRLEAMRQGRAAPALPVTSGAALATASLGQAAPDFVVPGITTSEDVRLKRVVGRPALLVFYTPTSGSADELLRFAQKLQDENPAQLTVLALSMSEDVEAARKQHADLKLGFPVGSGKGLRLSYLLDATPKLVLLDSAGVVRASYVGWGSEIPGAVTEELRRWLKPPSPR
jgi:peroxiredoxin